MSEWIEHDGKGMPVSGETLVCVKFRYGPLEWEQESNCRWADEWSHDNPLFSNWVHHNSGADITHYRVVKP